jgi:hypothetical protein
LGPSHTPMGRYHKHARGEPTPNFRERRLGEVRTTRLRLRRFKAPRAVPVQQDAEREAVRGFAVLHRRRHRRAQPLAAIRPATAGRDGRGLAGAPGGPGDPGPGRPATGPARRLRFAIRPTGRPGSSPWAPLSGPRALPTAAYARRAPRGGGPSRGARSRGAGKTPPQPPRAVGPRWVSRRRSDLRALRATLGLGVAQTCATQTTNPRGVSHMRCDAWRGG